MLHDVTLSFAAKSFFHRRIAPVEPPGGLEDKPLTSRDKTLLPGARDMARKMTLSGVANGQVSR